MSYVWIPPPTGSSCKVLTSIQCQQHKHTRERKQTYKYGGFAITESRNGSVYYFEFSTCSSDSSQ